MRGPALHMSKPHRRGTWAPPALTSVDLWALLGGLVAIASLRGFDYATGADRAGGSLSVVEDAFPLPVWGAFALTGAALLIAGMAAGAHALMFVGHGWLGGVYLALGIGVAISVAAHSPWWDGVRSGGDLLFFGALHVLLCFRTGPRPVTAEEPA